jgi:hypothetical protein
MARDLRGDALIARVVAAAESCLCYAVDLEADSTGSSPNGNDLHVLLGEWRAWWRERGENGLRSFLRQNWDAAADDDFGAVTDADLLALARHLHEGDSQVDVQWRLHELRARKHPERQGRKWVGRDRAVARKLVAWYADETGEAR